ncbi:hypothetical protein B0W47_10685 [Komagataeibacter nataicola]|uniref:Phospholipid/glycerol acyltransferase domain-containing protein n=1 Tax=Komagataeibacter nataicola TaxID=265960 RepID=A0A9N7CVL2_9PROT|nr:hypothetical protein B0W47_10685 [Komagataeibacter nataicola]
MARRGWHRIIFCIGLVYAVWAFAVFNTVALLLAPVVPRRWRGMVGRRWVWVMSRLSLNVLRGLGGIRCNPRDLKALAHIRNTVVVANHPSLMDAMLFTAYLPDLVCVTKQSLLDHPFYGAALRLAQYPGNDTPLRLIRSTVAHARAGQPILLFPEGTRSGRAQVNDAFPPPLPPLPCRRAVRCRQCSLPPPRPTCARALPCCTGRRCPLPIPSRAARPCPRRPPTP